MVVIVWYILQVKLMVMVVIVLFFFGVGYNLLVLFHNKNLILPRVKQSYGQHLFMFSAARVWNSLPTKLKDRSSLSSFNSKISQSKSVICYKLFVKLIIYYSYSFLNLIRLLYTCNIFDFNLSILFFWWSHVDYLKMLSATLHKNVLLLLLLLLIGN